MLSFRLLTRFPLKQMQSSTDATHGHTAQVISHNIINFV
jgi:hypothetical protein